MNYLLLFFSSFLFSQTLILEDSLGITSTIDDLQIDLNNTIYYSDELKNNLFKLDFITKKEIKSKYYSNISQLNLSNPFFISFVDENFNQVHFLDKELFETQNPYDLINSDNKVFIKNNMELLSYSIFSYEFCKVFYRKISNKKNCEIFTFPNIQNVILNEDFLILFSSDSIQINKLKQNTSSLIQLKNATNFKLFFNELFYVEDYFLYSINLLNISDKKKWIKINPNQKYALNNDFLVVENSKVFYFYRIN